MTLYHYTIGPVKGQLITLTLFYSKFKCRSLREIDCLCYYVLCDPYLDPLRIPALLNKQLRTSIVNTFCILYQDTESIRKDQSTDHSVLNQNETDLIVIFKICRFDF